MDRLKEIRKEISEIIAKYNITFEDLDDCYTFDHELNQQIESSYNLGRDETINRIEKLISKKYTEAGEIHKDALNLVECIFMELTSLKENKK